MGPNIEAFKGRLKLAMGDLTNNRKLRAAGRADEASGKAKQAVQQAADSVKVVVDKAKDKLA